MTNESRIFDKNRRKYRILLSAGIVLCAAVFILSLCLGNYGTSLPDVINAFLHPDQYPQIHNILLRSRLPRVLAAVFVGAALSASGMVYQDLFANRMASPDVLGVSAGAGVGASIPIFYGLSFSLVSLFSFLGGIISVSLTIITSRLFENKEKGSGSLILSGIVIGGLMNSLLGIFKYLANDAQLSTITFWLLGGFSKVEWNALMIVCPVVAVCLTMLFLLRWKIVMLRNGDEDARTHGIDAKRLRGICIVLATVITAVSVCISGTIGWIGLAIPNLMRLLVRNDGKWMLPLSIVYGMFFTELCDLLARTITNTEIPVGILSGILGAGMFIVVLFVQMKKEKS